jgi:hypothetical protein
MNARALALVLICALALFEREVRTSQATHHVSATKPSRLMLFGETVAIYCETHSKYISTLQINTLYTKR